MDKYYRSLKYSKKTKDNRHTGQRVGKTQRHNGDHHYRKGGKLGRKEKSHYRRSHLKKVVENNTRGKRAESYEEDGWYDWCTDLGLDEHGEPVCNGYNLIAIVGALPVQTTYRCRTPQNIASNWSGCEDVDPSPCSYRPCKWRGQHGTYTSKKKRWEAEGYTYRNGMRQNPRYITKRMMKPLRHGMRYREGLPYHGTDQMKEYRGMVVMGRIR